MTPDERRAWDRLCDEEYARWLLEETLEEIAASPEDVQDVLRRMLRDHLRTDFSASVDIGNDEQGSVRLLPPVC
jgi:hypothetical protein